MEYLVVFRISVSGVIDNVRVKKHKRGQKMSRNYNMIS